jgi:hypothetical protein
MTAKRADLSGVTDLFAVDEFISIVLAIVVIVMGPGWSRSTDCWRGG